MWKKFTFGVLGLLLLIAAAGAGYLYLMLPDVGPPPEITVEGTPEQVERGEYLAHHVASCIDCHSERNFTRFSGPIVPGTEGMGGEVFTPEMGFPGTFYARNLTPHNLGEWTDGEIYRTITTGVTRSGEPLFPVMPYPSYSRMDPDDVRAIIAYIRTLEPIPNETPESRPDFPLNLVMRTMPEPARPMERPPKSDTLAYGEYLTTIAACRDCHTPVDQGSFIDSLFMAGGREFEMPWGTVRSSNITPHARTGLGEWDREQFVERFKQYDVPYDSLDKVSENAFNTLMPWAMYAGMTEEDLSAIFRYLQTVEPIEHPVTRFTPAGQGMASVEE